MKKISNVDSTLIRPFQMDQLENGTTEKLLSCYEEVVDNLLEKNELKYVPALYIVPFIFCIGSSVYSEKLKRNLPVKSVIFGLTTVDHKNHDRYAIYLSKKFASQAPSKYVSAALAHELIHVISRQNKRFPAKEIFKAAKKGMPNMFIDQIKDREVWTDKKVFNPEIHSWMLELEERKIEKEFFSKYVENQAEQNPDDFVRSFLDGEEILKMLRDSGNVHE